MPKKTGKLADAIFGEPSQAAFGVFPQMKPRRSRQDPEAAKNVPIDLARGFVSGAAGQLGDIESIIRLLPGFDEKTVLPTSEDIEKRIPLKSDTPVSRAATGLGQLAGGFYTGPGSALRLAMGIPGAIVKATKDFAMAAGQSVSPLTVYHGSPHRFAPTPKNPLGEFDPTKIGTGEGAQAYGYGHYVAEAQDVAKNYQPRSPEYEQKLLEKYNRAQARRDYPTMEILEDAMLHKSPDEIIQRFTNTENGYTPAHAKAAKDFVNWYAKNPPEVGGLYKVDLADEKIARMLDYDKPINEQTPEVKALLEKAGINTESSAKAGTMIGGQEQHLARHGIPGVKYLDDGSRGAGEGTRNFVIFPGEEDALTILERKKEGGAVSFTDNPDAMRLELAGGGLVKGLKAAVKSAKTEAQAAKEAPTIIIPGKVSRVEEAVRQSKGDYGAKRVQRAADEVPNLERIFQEEALRQAFMGDNAKAMATIKPQDFEKFAEPLERSSDFRWGYAKGLPDMTQQEYLDYLMKIEGGFSDVPYLELNKARAGEPGTVWVSGHEGRHRNRALANRGENASIVQILPRAELREPLPRRSQEEYIEALRKELGPKVRPQQNLTGEGPRDRPLIDMPDIYAEGGAVEMQAGGLARLFGGGAKAAKSAEKAAAVPLDLPRVRPTKQDIIEAAERVGKQQAGEHVTSPLLGKTENLAGRSMREAQRVKDLRYEVKPIKDLPPVGVYQPKIGEVNIALPGDQTIADAILVSVDDIPVGSVQEGGALFGRGRLQDPEDKRAFWASNVGPAQIFQNKVTDIAQKYDTDMVTAYHLAMGTDANNFAQHFADANLRAIDYSKLSKKDMEKFDRAIADGYTKKNKKTGEYVHTSFPEWPGIANPEASYQAMKENPELRKWFNNRMKTEKLTKATNMPDGRSIEWAITEPEIRNMEINMTGLSAGRMKPGAELIPDSAHQTYSHDIPGTALGRAEELAPFSISFPDVTDFVRQKYRPQDFTGTIQKVFPHQVVDEAYLEDMYNYYTQLRKVRGFQEGGAVNKAAGGDITAEDLTIEERPL